MEKSKQRKKLARQMELMTPSKQWAFYKRREFWLEEQRKAYAKTGKQSTLALIKIMEDNVRFIHDIAAKSYKSQYPKPYKKPKQRPLPKKEFVPGIYKRTKNGTVPLAPPGFSMMSWGI